MNHDVFISFSSIDTDVAKKVCEYLEQSGEVKCWIAFRDIVPSANYAEQLVEAIESAKLLLLILSDASNRSPQVSREIERAGSKAIPILPFRIEDVALSKSMEYFISSHHWLDAFESDVEDYLPALFNAVQSSLRKGEGKPAESETGKPRSFTKPVKKKSAQTKTIIGAGTGLALLIALIFYMQTGNRSHVEQAGNESVTSPADSITTAQIPLSPVDSLVKDLAKRYKSGDIPQKQDSDSWSSRPLSIAFLDINGTDVGQAEQEFILNRTAEELRATGRYSIVEREIIDKLLKELNLSTSELADPSTALKLGKILSANLIVTGSMTSRAMVEWLVNLRFIETETTEVKCSVSVMVPEGGPDKVADELSAKINEKLRNEYPLQGKITSISGKFAALDIGKNSGVKKGMTFDLLQDGKMAIDNLTVTEVEPDQSYIALLNNESPVSTGMLVREQTGSE